MRRTNELRSPLLSHCGLILLAGLLAGCGGKPEELPARLSDLRTVSPAQARELSRRKEALLLDGAGDLSDESIALLAGREGGLSLGGLPTLSDAAAAALADHRGWLALNGLRTLAPSAAAALARHDGPLYLEGLESLIDEALAAKLAGQSGGLQLHRLDVVEDPALAELVAQGEGALFLPRVTALEPAIARVLAGHRGVLVLDGLVELSAEVAAELARHEGAISLAGIVDLPDEAAAALVGGTQEIFLPRLERVSEATAATLAARPSVHLGRALADRIASSAGVASRGGDSSDALAPDPKPTIPEERDASATRGAGSSRGTIRVHVTRDSVSMGDDVEAPHADTFEVPRDATLRDLFNHVAEAKYLAGVAGQNHFWTALIGGETVATFAGNDRSPQPSERLDDPVSRYGGTVTIHFSYKAAID